MKIQREIKYRQPMFDRKGKFEDWHYWGFGIDVNGFRSDVYPLNFKYNICDPKQSLQFIGKLDVNGKEVYEGDKDQDGGVVVWNEDSASFCIDYPNIELMPIDGDLSSWMIVSGNIYEN